MRYLKITFVIFMLFVVIIFCVNNTQPFHLSFWGYRLMVGFQLWMLLLIFFIGGMVPIFVMELPRSVSRYARVRSLKAQIRQMEGELQQGMTSPGDPQKEMSGKAQ